MKHSNNGYFETLGEFARVDHQRGERNGIPELVYAESKTPQQLVRIMGSLAEEHGYALASRVRDDQVEMAVSQLAGAVYNPTSRLLTVGQMPTRTTGKVLVLAAGTSDLPVAEEAVGLLTFLGDNVERLYDVGVAGLHRLLPHVEILREADAVIVVAGMEGALPTVVGGLIDAPLIAVPTSVGYGASLNGIAALLGMLNSCVPGLTVVNIDNGIGAASAAHRILHRITRHESDESA